MRTIIIIIILLITGLNAHSQKGWFWGNLDKSPRPVVRSTNSQNGTNYRTHALTAVPAGALLVITTQCEDDYGNAVITSSPSLTWTKRADAQASSSGSAEIWTATFTAGGSITITSDFGSHKQSSVAWVITGQETTPGGAAATATGQSSPSRTITTTRTNSLLICVTSDWNAVDGVGRMYRDFATEVQYYFSSGACTGYHYYKPAPTIMTYTEGLTAPTTQGAGTVILEVRAP